MRSAAGKVGQVLAGGRNALPDAGGARSPASCREVAAWSCGLSWDGLPTAVRTRAVDLLLDTVGCALAARGHPAVVQAANAADLFGAAGGCTGLGGSRNVSALAAILESGAAIRALDYNDFYWGAGFGGHPSDLFASALAIAEAADASVGRMLCAVVAGYEVYCRLLDQMEAALPFDHTAACAMASAVMAGLVADMGQVRLADAIAIAAVRAPVLSGLRYGRISSTKAVAPALAQIDGVIAARLAAEGFTGPVEAVDTSNGLAAILRDDGQTARLAPRPHEGMRILDVAVKRYPCIGTAQAAVSGAADVHRRLAGNVAGVRRISVRLTGNHTVRHQVGDVYRRPDRRETADHSFYAVIAMALADGDLSASQFEAERWRQADVVDLIDRMDLAADLPGAEEGRFAASMAVTCADGRSIEVDVPTRRATRAIRSSRPTSSASFAETQPLSWGPAVPGTLPLRFSS